MSQRQELFVKQRCTQTSSNRKCQSCPQPAQSGAVGVLSRFFTWFCQVWFPGVLLRSRVGLLHPTRRTAFILLVVKLVDSTKHLRGIRHHRGAWLVWASFQRSVLREPCPRQGMVPELRHEMAQVENVGCTIRRSRAEVLRVGG